MVADMLSNKKFNPVVTELFIRSRKLNIYFVSITQSYFVEPSNVILHSVDYFIMRILNKRKLQQIAFNHSSDIDLKALWSCIKNVLQNHTLFLVIEATFASDDPLRFRKNPFRKNIKTSHDN